MAKTTKRSSPGRKKPPENETLSQTFDRLATARTNNAINKIRLIGQLVGPSYESTNEKRRAIVLSLKDAVEFVENIFTGKAKVSDTFKLPE